MTDKTPVFDWDAYNAEPAQMVRDYLDAYLEVLEERLSELRGQIQSAYSSNNTKVLEGLCYDLFFNQSLSPTTSSKILTRLGITNYVGEQDSYGPLSWVICTKTPNTFIVVG
jgi:hypothetical protein